MARCNGPCLSSAGTSGSSITDLVCTYRPSLMLRTRLSQLSLLLRTALDALHGSPASSEPPFARLTPSSVLLNGQLVYPVFIDLFTTTLIGTVRENDWLSVSDNTTLTADSHPFGDREACVNVLLHTDAVYTGRLLHMDSCLREFANRVPGARRTFSSINLRSGAEVPAASLSGTYTVLLSLSCAYVRGDGQTSDSCSGMTWSPFRRCSLPSLGCSTTTMRLPLRFSW